jgi:hypothetical protein
MNQELLARYHDAHLAGHAFRTQYNAQAGKWHGIVAVAPHMRPEFAEGSTLAELVERLLAASQSPS